MILTNKIMMVRPNTFRSNEETLKNNFFQKKFSKSEQKNLKNKVLKEFDNLVYNLEKNNIDVSINQGSLIHENPDEIFSNNWIIFDDKKIGIFSMFAKNRRTEINKDYIKLLSKNNYKFFDYSKYALKNIFLEGTGSMVLDRENKKAYCCISERSNKSLFLIFCKDFEYEPILFNANQNVNGKKKPIYHTNVMMSIGPKICVICLDSIDDNFEKNSVINNLAANNKILSISNKQMESFAANIIFLKSNATVQIVISETAINSLTNFQINILENIGNIITCEIPTIEKFGGGGVRCMITEVF